MSKYRIRIDPSKEEITYEIEGDLDDITNIDKKTLNQLNEYVLKLQNEQFKKSKKTKKEENTGIDEKSELEKKSILDVPLNLIESINSLKVEEKIPVLWYYSTNEKMTVAELFQLAVQEGFSLSHVWLPSAGGSFAAKFANKIFYSNSKKGKEKIWQFTKVGKFKTKQFITNLEKDIQTK